MCHLLIAPLEYRPECYLEREEAGARRRPGAGPEASQKIWTLPPAGKSFRDAAAFGEAPAAAPPAKLATAQGAAAGQPPGVAGRGAAVGQPAASAAGSSASHALSVSFAPGSTATGRTHEVLRKGRQMGCRAPNQGLEGSFCHWIARQGLAADYKECLCSRTPALVMRESRQGASKPLVAAGRYAFVQA